MKQILALWLAAMLVAVQPCYAVVLVGFGTVKSDPTLLIQEDGTGSGWTNSTTPPSWGVDGTSIGMDSAVAYLQSLTNAFDVFSYKGFADSGEVYIYTKIYISSASIASSLYKRILSLNSSGTTIFSLNVYNLSSTYRMLVGCGSTAYTTGTLSEDTLYHVKVRYKNGTGSNAVCQAEFSTTGTFAGSGSSYVSKTDGSLTSTVNRLYINPGVNALDIYYDKIRVYSADFGSSEPL